MTEYKQDYLSTLTTFKDTIFLGFILGGSEDHAREHARQLVKSQQIGPLQSFTLTSAGSKKDYRAYPHKFTTNKVSSNSTIEPHFANGKLIALELTIPDLSEALLVEYLKTRFGEPFQIVRVKGSYSYKTDSYNYAHIWVNNNTEISLNYPYLRYMDLKYKLEQEVRKSE